MDNPALRESGKRNRGQAGDDGWTGVWVVGSGFVFEQCMEQWTVASAWMEIGFDGADARCDWFDNWEWDAKRSRMDRPRVSYDLARWI